MPANATLLIYTDGVTEASNAGHELFGLARTQQSLMAHRQDSAQAVCDAVWNEVRAFVGDAPQHDDVTLLTLKLA